jgi:hypothetical protein
MAIAASHIPCPIMSLRTSTPCVCQEYTDFDRMLCDQILLDLFTSSIGLRPLLVLNSFDFLFWVTEESPRHSNDPFGPM